MAMLIINNTKAWIVSTFIILLAFEAFIVKIEGEGECGKTTPIESAAASLSPCLNAVKNARIKVPTVCCSKVRALFKISPKCLCAILLSPVAKMAGINPSIAITIPKRCNIKNRPVGNKCGKYTLP